MQPHEFHIYSIRTSNMGFPYSPIAVHPDSVESGGKNTLSKTLSLWKIKTGHIQCLSRRMTMPYTNDLLYVLYLV